MTMPVVGGGISRHSRMDASTGECSQSMAETAECKLKCSRNDNRAAQEAADNDNFRSATARVCNNDTMADIGTHNIASVHKLYHPPVAPCWNIPLS